MIYQYLLTALHVIVCVILILVVLLQSGKSADLAGAFGGGASQTAFGSRGPASFLSKLTTAAAVLFMLTSMSLSLMKTKTTETSVMDSVPSTEAPASQTPEKEQPAATPMTPEEIQRIQREVEAKQQQKATGTVEQPQPETSPDKGP